MRNEIVDKITRVIKTEWPNSEVYSFVLKLFVEKCLNFQLTTIKNKLKQRLIFSAALKQASTCPQGSPLLLLLAFFCRFLIFDVYIVT